jgi:hypothetical protein
MALGSTQPQTEMSTRNLSEGKAWLARMSENFTAIYEPIISQPYWPPRPVTGITFFISRGIGCWVFSVTTP